MRRLIVTALVVTLAANVAAQDVAAPPLFEGRSAAEWTALLPSEEVAERQMAAYALWSLRADADAAALALVMAIADDDAYVRTTAAKSVLRPGDAARSARCRRWVRRPRTRFPHSRRRARTRTVKSPRPRGAR